MPKFVPQCTHRLIVLADGLVDRRLYEVLVTPAAVLKGITRQDLRILVGSTADIGVNWERIAEIVAIDDSDSVGQAVVNCARIVAVCGAGRITPLHQGLRRARSSAT
jgi:hypothetical protein